MDQSEQYQKMMITAWPDIKESRPIGNMLFSRRLRMLYILDGEIVFWREKVNTSNYDRATPLLEQDQLQEMIGEYPEVFERFANSVGQNDFNYGLEEMGCYELWGTYNNLTSMEQLWLAFCMSEKYNKVWDGAQWQLK